MNTRIYTVSVKQKSWEWQWRVLC